MWYGGVAQKAIEAFGDIPCLGSELQDPQYTYYMVFFDLLPMVREAHDSGDIPTLRNIYGFAEWCFRQYSRAPDLNNAVCVAFYEHLFDERRHWEDVIVWLPSDIIQACWTLWEARLTCEELRELRSLIQKRGKVAR